MEIEKESFIFQSDNDPKHTSKVAQKYIEESHINVLPWPPQSPDLNPIENLWAFLKKNVGQIKNKKMSNLTSIVREEWEKLGENKELLRNLVGSMPSRINEVIKAKGYHTNY